MVRSPKQNINAGEMVEGGGGGNKTEAVYMISDWTHNIINLSETEKHYNGDDV